MRFLRRFLIKKSGLVTQNDRRLPKEVRLWGCNFRCLLAMGEIYTGKKLSVEDIKEAYYDLSRDSSIMDKECTLGHNLRLIIDWSLLKLGNSGFGHQIGTQVEGGQYNFWYGDWNIVDFTVLHGRTENGNDHYRLGLGLTNKVFFDPYPGTKIYKEIMRIFYHVREA